MRKIDLARAILLGSSAAFIFAVPASAQTAAETNQQANDQPASAEATTAANDEGKDTATDENITVTARRTSERLQDVPAAVSAFNERTLDRLQAVDPTGLQGAVPNLNIVQGRGSSNAMNIYIRGVGQPDALQTFDPAVGVYVDDVYLSRIRGTQLDLLDIDRIEVLRGPQGTLYGKNTIGGALKVVTHRPGDDFRASGSIAIGSYNQFEAKGVVSGPIAAGISLGLALLTSKHDGYVKDELNDREYNDKDTKALRGDIAITPIENLRIDISGDYTWEDTAMTVGQPLNDLTTAYTPFFGTILPVGNLYEDGYHFTAQISPNLPNSLELRHRGLSGTVAYDVSDQLTLKSITALRKMDTADNIDIDASIWNTGDVFVGVDQKQFSQEFQALYKSERLSGVAGLYYLNERIKSHQEAYGSDYLRFSPLVAPPAFLRTIDDDLSTKSYAAFVNGTYAVMPNVNLSAGIRFTHESKDYDRSTTRYIGGAFYDIFPFSGKDHWNDWSPMASIDYHPTEDVMVYAKVSKGFKSGGFNGRANSVQESTEYDPETVSSYEAGVKTRWFDQLTLNLTIFHNDYKDFQARVGGCGEIDPITLSCTPLLSVLNAGKLRIQGAELEAAWTPVRGLLLDSQVGYLDAEYKEFDDTRFPDGSVGGPPFPNGSRAFQTPAFSPKWTIRGGAQYSFEIGNAGNLTIGGQARYKSRTALAVDNTYILYPPTPGGSTNGTGTDVEVPGLFQKGYWLADARIVWEDLGKHLALGLYANNLFDKEYRTDAQEFSSVGSIRTVYYGAPRTFTLRFTARY
ncbi:TonB-dependent receptor [Sphingomonas alba]|uniref:TonB-dependent receptor n=1 Tax=Sphingomonas alba TaxID=2908208 RepID=A0ABT0RMS6_9SPHN|nr:TonB-dependent receptor [Sphingomonas alba]MCL6683890.1 TonB-dependent receptor [Sphingomonas alba]